MPLSPFELTIALAVTLVAAVVQGTVGIGFSVVSVPILSLLNPILAPVPQLLLAAPLSLAMTWRERHAIDARGVGWMLAGRVPGALIGLWILGLAAQRSIDVGIALSVLVAVLILGTGLKVPRNAPAELGTGIAAGVMGMVASMGGPPAALLFKDSEGPTIRASLSLFFSGGLLVTILFRIGAHRISHDDLTITALLLPGLVAGYLISSRLRHLLDSRGIRPAILAISSV
ncbi:MAG: sulfite exporter TauE/SafE family protein, partial [Acidimicrobiia bacterium]